MLAKWHWPIENQLHWDLDVTSKEDASRARMGCAAQIASRNIIKGYVMKQVYDYFRN